MNSTKIKSLGLGLASALGLALCANTTQADISLDFSNLPRTAIQFNGAASSFQLNPLVGGPQFQIVNDTGGTGAAIDLKGFVDSGPWSYGPITVNGGVQSATVTAGGVLHITDGSSIDLMGNVDWIKIATLQTAGAVNAALTVNVTGLSYGGSNADLLSLASSGNGSMNLTFQFSPGKTLTELTTGTDTFRSSYSGSISSTPVPEPTTILAGALLLLPFGLSTVRMLRRKNG